MVKELKEADAHEINTILSKCPLNCPRRTAVFLNASAPWKRNNPKFRKKVLAAVALTLRPVAVCELSALADLPPDVPIEKILSKCGSFVLVHADMVYAIH